MQPLPRPRGGSAEIGPGKRGKGRNLMAIVDRHGLPLAVGTHTASHHEVTLVQLSFEFYMTEAKPENLIGGRAYDSDKLDEELRQEGIEVFSSSRQGRVKPRTQDGRRLRRYERRWLGTASSSGYSGNVDSSADGNITPGILPGSCR